MSRARMWMLGPALFVSLSACNQSQHRGVGADLGVGEGSGLDLAAGSGDGGTKDGGPTMSCLPDTIDAQGCACDPTAAPRACYPSSAPAGTRGKGLCTDGTQSCVGAGEFAAWGACTGATLPAGEQCADGKDNNCDGLVDCKDPTCTTQAVCKGPCQNGQTRACYTGDPNTVNVGTCRAGTQTCVNNNWPTNCPGEILPAAEDCTDAADHNCNHLPGCLDLFACALSMVCQNNCKNPDNGCLCPMGAGDTALCPQGYIGVDKGFIPPQTECCPCTAQTCDNPGCCAEAVCAGNPSCQGLTCTALPASCNGMQNADCDDFPEDCDEPCCPCTMCP